MIKGQVPIVPVWYEPKAENDGDPKTRFRLAPLSGLQRLNMLSEPGDRRVLAVLRDGIVGFEHLVDHEGKEVPADTPTLVVINMLSDKVLLDLSNQILDMSRLGEAAKKN